MISRTPDSFAEGWSGWLRDRLAKVDYGLENRWRCTSVETYIAD